MGSADGLNAVYVGIDQALRASGLCAFVVRGGRADLGSVRFNRVQFKGKGEASPCDISGVANGIWSAANLLYFDVRGEDVLPKVACLEGHLFLRHGKTTRILAELTGALFHVFCSDGRWGDARRIDLRSARKTILGKLKRGSGKAEVLRRVRALGIDAPDHDCADAFVLAYAAYLDDGGIDVLKVRDGLWAETKPRS